MMIDDTCFYSLIQLDAICQQLAVDGWATLLRWCMAVQWLWVSVVTLSQLVNISQSLTTNEQINGHKYDYLSSPMKERADPNGRIRFHRTSTFHNPFDRGGPIGNCTRFWWSEPPYRWMSMNRIDQYYASEQLMV
jgi:hypothetical protein